MSDATALTGVSPDRYSLYTRADTPSLPFWSDSPVELGVKFRSDVAGVVTGIRFYKNASNTGVHTGSLWSSNGDLLATGTFTNETDSGWQQLTFANPAAIEPNTIYIASYHANVGFSVNVLYLADGTLDNGPLHAPRHSDADPNGVFIYGPGGQFPSSGSNGHYYWVDVVFAPSDVPAPAVSLNPAIATADGTADVSSLSAVASPAVATVSASSSVLLTAASLTAVILTCIARGSSRHLFPPSPRRAVKVAQEVRSVQIAYEDRRSRA